jgi:hypothetical protein
MVPGRGGGAGPLDGAGKGRENLFFDLELTTKRQGRIVRLSVADAAGPSGGSPEVG